MVEENDKFGICYSNTSTDTDSLQSVTDEVLKNGRNTCRLLEDIDALSCSTLTQYNRIVESSKINQTTDCCEKYFNAPRKILHEHQKSMKYHIEEIKIKKDIRELERKLKSSLLKNQIISQEELALQKKKAVTEEALCLAKKYYSSVWDMNINIEDSKEDQFTCIINFKFDCGMYPIKFVIDRNNQEIINWDGSSLLTIDEEKEMKERYSGTDHYFPRVLSELRLLALNKIKMF